MRTVRLVGSRKMVRGLRTEREAAVRGWVHMRGGLEGSGAGEGALEGVK